jgi:hypothetical protein
MTHTTCINIIFIKIICKRLIDSLYNYTPFSKLASHLNNKDTIHLSNTFLNKILTNPSNIHPKKFLSIFMIKHHPNVLLTNNTEIERQLKENSNKLYNIILDLYNSKNKFSYNYYKSRFIKYYSKYILSFDTWKKFDKYKILNDLSTIYLELEQDKNKKYEDLDDLTNHEFITSIEREQKKLVKKIESIAGQEGLEYLNSLKLEIEKYKKNIEDLYVRINDNLHQSYWDNIQLELSKSPPNLTVIIDLLKELKELLLSCNSNLENELNSNIDIPFISEMLDRGVIDDKYIREMCNYIIKVIKENHSSSYDDGLDKFKNKIHDDLDNGMFYREFFPMFFREVFERLEVLLKEIDITNKIRDNLEN